MRAQISQRCFKQNLILLIFFFADLAKKVPIDNYVPENRDEVNTKPAEAGQSLLLRE